MDSSILNSIKKMLGLDAAYSAFDADIIAFINAALLTLAELGIGPTDPYSIVGETETWTDFLGPEFKNLKAVVTCVYLKVKIVFDPPASQAVLTSYTNTIAELEWRLNARAEKLA